MTKKYFNRLSPTLIPFTGRQLIRLLAATMRIEYVNYDGVWSMWRGGRNVIVAFWHGRLMMMPIAYRVVYCGKGISILVSHHRDGELVARTVKGLGIDSVRGSSTRGWFGGVKGLLKAARSGRDLAITPDGPKGPRYNAQAGIVQIARVTGLPIIPMAFGAAKKKTFRSWDAFLLPYPFSRGVFICGDPITVERESSDKELEEKRQLVEQVLNEVTERADSYFD
ncbi:MAG: lysophospholipid acyltransferase family protein [Deltaproteobacteria bacterium]|nr:lysophospholipid acyltransferase family protein [Deltaproteobacteria bacterium]